MSGRDEAVELIRAGRRFLVTCHVRPDGDALGSALGFAAILRALDKEVVVFSRDPAPLSLQFLPGLDGVIGRVAPTARFDATFVMDTAARALLPSDFPPRHVTGPVVVVDHHSAHDGFGDIHVREVDACATGEVVIRLMHDLGIAQVPPEGAVALYTSIVTDTGGFRYRGTTAETLRIGADLLEAGVDPWQVAYEVFEGWPRERLKLLGSVLETLHTYADGRIALLTVRRAALRRTGANDDMVEGLVNFARQLRGVEIAGLVWELEPVRAGRKLVPQTKISLRSRGNADVSHVAVALGGGGHRAAAGSTLAVGVRAAAVRLIAEAGAELVRVGLGGPRPRSVAPRARKRTRSGSARAKARAPKD